MSRETRKRPRRTLSWCLSSHTVAKASLTRRRGRRREGGPKAATSSASIATRSNNGALPVSSARSSARSTTTAEEGSAVSPSRGAPRSSKSRGRGVWVAAPPKGCRFLSPRASLSHLFNMPATLPAASQRNEPRRRLARFFSFAWPGWERSGETSLRRARAHALSPTGFPRRGLSASLMIPKSLFVSLA